MHLESVHEYRGVKLGAVARKSVAPPKKQYSGRVYTTVRIFLNNRFKSSWTVVSAYHNGGSPVRKA